MLTLLCLAHSVTLQQVQDQGDYLYYEYYYEDELPAQQPPLPAKAAPKVCSLKEIFIPIQ